MNILLLEPGYTAKYPPLGLMKIAAYHKHCRGDFVWLSKGEPPMEVSDSVKKKLRKSKYYSRRYDIDQYCEQANEVLKAGNWDRVYITTLFTFEWQKAVAMIEYAKSLVPLEHIFVGGILASLMPTELETATGIKPMMGLLRSSNELGFDDDVDIDLLTPDYSILDNTEYSYKDQDAYFTSFTKGCGMKCSFCAVQRLEPNYEPYRNVAAQIAEIDELYGPRRHLLLMDNNVLISKCFDQIIEEIIALGFGKGATFIHPKTGKRNERYVDFNQGLDANLLTEHKAKQLARLAIRPVRIAFDHIDDHEKYMRAITLAEQAGIDHISNYMLYNTPQFKGKGKPRRADTPEDLYERIRLNVSFSQQANAQRKQDGQPKLILHSFPMQYIPLDGIDRSYIGENWCPKTYQAVKRMLHITMGIVYPGGAAFEAVFGETINIFKARLWMPKLYLDECLSVKASLSSENTRHKDPLRFQVWERAYEEWLALYESLSSNETKEFEDAIKCAAYSIEQYALFSSKRLRNLYLHHFSSTALVDFLERLRKEDIVLFREATDFLRNKGRVMYDANIFAMAKLKTGEELAGKLRCMVEVYVVQKIYKPKQKINRYDRYLSA